MFGLPPELLVLPPLAIAAGVDLYLTLLFIGAAPTTGLWDSLPGALRDLDSPGVLLMVGTFFILEFWAERFPPTALAWNAFHAIIRPVSGALLALLLLDGHPPLVLVFGALAGAVLASIAHAVRSGSAVLRWLGAGVAPSTLLVSLTEDVLVLGIVALALDAPLWAFGLSVFAAFALATRSRSLLRAFRYAVGLAVERLFQSLRQRRWRNSDELPSWLQGTLQNDDPIALGAAARGTRAGAWRIDGGRRFLVGWVVIRGSSRLFAYRRYGSAVSVDLDGFRAGHVLDQDLFRRVDLERSGLAAFLLIGSSGPSTESLSAEFGAREQSVDPSSFKKNL